MGKPNEKQEKQETTSQEALQEVVDKGAESLGLAKPEVLTKGEIRNRLVTGNIKADRKNITLFGVSLDIVQPPLKAVMRMRDELDQAERSAQMIINFAYVPGTDERAFEDADIEAVLNWPWSPDVTDLNSAITELTGIDIGAAEEALEKDPLKGQS